MAGGFNPPHPDEVPATVAEALDVLEQILPVETLEWLGRASDDQILDQHFGLAMGLRNQFGLWDPESPLMANLAARTGGPVHPDDAGAALLRMLRDRRAAS